MKANVANYLIQDLTSRYPINNEDVFDSDLIEVVIDDWANNKFFTNGHNVKFNREYKSAPHYIM